MLRTTVLGAVACLLFPHALQAQAARPYVTALQPGESLVAGDNYSHFPRLAQSANGRLGVIYYRGFNHGGRDEEGIAAVQRAETPTGQPLLINGTYSANGIATLPAPAQIVIAADRNESKRTFTVIGTDRFGDPLSERVRGPAFRRSFSRGAFSAVTAVLVDGPTDGPIRIGPRTVPSNVEFRFSDDRGATWSSPIMLGDGIGGSRFHYWTALAGLADGTFIAIFLTADLTEGRTATMQRVSRDNGVTWSPAQPLVYTGEPPKLPLNVWAQIKATPNGRLVAMAYRGEENWALVSDDKGESWRSKLIVRKSPGANYSEMAVAIASEQDWIVVSRGAKRGEFGGMRQFATRDAGRSWIDMGPTNAAPAGGDVSPSMQVTRCGGRDTLVWAYMARASRSLPPPIPDSLIVRYAPAEAALRSASVWSPAQVLGVRGSFTHRSGYPSLVLDPDCQGGVLVAGRETSFKTSQVVSMDFKLPASIRASVLPSAR